MKWYRFEVDEYLDATEHLLDSEDLAYRRLLDMYYITEEPLPNDIRLLEVAIRLNKEEFERVLEEFFVLTPDGYRHHQADMWLKKRIHQRDINLQAGLKGGRRKKVV